MVAAAPGTNDSDFLLTFSGRKFFAFAQTIHQPLAEQDPKDVFGKDRLVDELKKALSERILNTDLDAHLDAEHANECRRFGYRRLAVMLKRGGRKRALGTRAAMTVPQAANQRWSIDFVQDALDDGRRPATRSNETCAMDFVHDQLATGRKLRMLTIVDFTFRGADVVEVLERVGREVGLPAAIRVDQGTEFVSRDLDLWAYQRGVTLDFSRSGKPADTDVVDKPYAARGCFFLARGFARHRDAKFA
jgi:hypothetical protein